MKFPDVLHDAELPIYNVKPDYSGSKEKKKKGFLNIKGT